MLRYFIIRDSETPNNVLAIHKVLDAAHIWFMKTAQDGVFKGTLYMVCIEVDDCGIKHTEVLLYTYEKGDVAVTLHAVVNGGRLVPM